MINHKSIKNLEKIILNLIDFFKFLQNKNNLRILVFHNIEKNDYKLTIYIKIIKMNFFFGKYEPYKKANITIISGEFTVNMDEDVNSL